MWGFRAQMKWNAKKKDEEDEEHDEEDEENMNVCREFVGENLSK